MGEFWVWVARAAIIYSTVRVAYSRGRSPWLWGLVALLLGFLPAPWYLLSMAPVAILLLLGVLQPRPTAGQHVGDPTSTPACPRCHTPRASQHRYCTNCGWELRKPYQPEDTASKAIVQTGANQGVRQSRDTGAGAQPEGPPPSEKAQLPNVTPLSTDDKTVAPDQSVPKPSGAPAAGATAAPAISGGKGTFNVPTAANLTERGLALFNQGRVQEAIDQFTKAIALDPKYKSAWAHRAEAYAKLGRRKEAAEDMHRLEAI